MKNFFTKERWILRWVLQHDVQNSWTKNAFWDPYSCLWLLQTFGYHLNSICYLFFVFRRQRLPFLCVCILYTLHQDWWIFFTQWSTHLNGCGSIKNLKRLTGRRPLGSLFLCTLPSTIAMKRTTWRVKVCEQNLRVGLSITKSM